MNLLQMSIHLQLSSKVMIRTIEEMRKLELIPHFV